MQFILSSGMHISYLSNIADFMKKKCTKILSSLVVGKRRVSDYYNNGCSIFTIYLAFG